MNHPSECTRFFDENTGSYRYKHKGSGVIRDTLMTIGKVFIDTVKNVAKKTAEKATKTIAEKAGQKVGELAVEKGLKQIEQQMQSYENKKWYRRMQKRNLQIFCKSKNRCLWMQKRNLQIFCKTKYQKNKTPL